jgi:hypothetical protein
MSSGNNFSNAMRDGVCSTTVAVDSTVSPGTGFAQVKQAFEERMQTNPQVTIAVVNDFGNGNAPVVVIGFIAADIINITGSGNNPDYQIQLRLVKRIVGNAGGGPNNPPFGLSRVLIQ